MRKTFPRSLLAIGLLAAGCSALPTATAGGTLKGQVSGTGLPGGKTKVAVLDEVPVPSNYGNATVVDVGADGTWAFPIPAGKTELYAFAFKDADGNGKLDRTDPNSYEKTKCTTDCSYVVATQVGGTWKVQIKTLAPTSSDGELANANIRFDAS